MGGIGDESCARASSTGGAVQSNYGRESRNVLLAAIRGCGNSFWRSACASASPERKRHTGPDSRAADTRDTGLVVMPDVFTVVHRSQIISLVAVHRLVALYPYRYFAENGGVMSYG